MRDFVILVDMDDTIENLLSAWIEYLNKKHSTSVKRDEVISWNIPDFFHSIDAKSVYEPLHDKDFWKTVEVKEDAVEYMRKLFDEGFQIYICTNSCIDTLQEKLDAILYKHFPYIDDNHIIITSNKQMIKADVLVDDGPHNHVGGEYAKLLFCCPHNKSFNAESYGIIRVHDWKEVYGNIHELYANKMTIK